MDAKQNALEIMGFGQPERVTEGPPTRGISYYGVNHEGHGGGGHHLHAGSAWTDIWGTGWVKEQEGVMGFPRVSPLAEMESLATYRWPDPDDPRICAQIHGEAHGGDPGASFLCGSHRDTLWEKGYMLVGMENLMVYMHTDPGYAKEVFHRIMDFQLGIAQHYLAEGVEMVGMSDDLGTQRGPLIHPDMVLEFLVPEYRRLFSLYKRAGVLVNFHSCGNILAFCPMFIDLGVDILNPIQATANDLNEVRRLTQGRMALQGAVSTGTLMAGPIEAIEREVSERLLQLGRGGGYFCSPDQGMPFPEANIAAFHEALERNGKYPM